MRRRDQTFGQTTEVRVGGSGVSASSPDFKVALIFPKATLQALGLSARNADSFNVCLGATRLVTGDPYQAKPTAEGSGLVAASLSGGAYWGWLANCSAVPAGNPCITLRTKNAGSLKAELGMTNAQFMPSASSPATWRSSSASRGRGTESSPLGDLPVQTRPLIDTRALRRLRRHV